MSEADWQKKWGELVTKSWEDDNLRDRLLADATAVLKEHGVQIPPGVQIKAVQNSPNMIYLPLPPKPSSDEISEEELAAVVGGAGTYHYKVAQGGVENPALKKGVQLPQQPPQNPAGVVRKF